MKRAFLVCIALAAATPSAIAQQIFNNPSGSSFRTNAEFGHNGVSSGQATFSGSTSGSVNVQVPAAAGSYNFNLPTSAGTSGQPLCSGGGGATVQSYCNLGIGAGGTGGTTAQSAMAALKGVYILGASAVVSSITGTTSETTLATIAVPANAMGANGVLRITVQWGYSGGTSSWTPRIKFNGTAYSDPSTFGNTSLSGRTQTQIANRNATNSQVGMGVQQINFAGVASAVTTSAHDTTASQNITLTCQLANSGDTCRMDAYAVELMVP